MDLPAEPEEQHEREGKGGGKARLATVRKSAKVNRMPVLRSGVAQDEIGERPGTNELLHAPSNHS
jgi:hypothetical protein